VWRTQAGCPSGQWERTVNPSAKAYTGSNPVPATKVRGCFGLGWRVRVGLLWTQREQLVIFMTMSEVSSLAEAKAHLSELVARVGDQHERITVTVHGRPVAVLLAVDDLESLEETIAVLSDATAPRALREADAELARGEGENQDILAAAMQARRART
jgi:antitoxin YefM